MLEKEMTTPDAMVFLEEMRVGDTYFAFSEEAEMLIRQSLIQAFEFNAPNYFHRISTISEKT